MIFYHLFYIPCFSLNFKGLPQSVNDEALRKLFEPFGILKDVRLATFRNGYSKGIAYIEYEEEVSLQPGVIRT